MKLEVGKKYKTRNGKMAHVASVKGYGPQSVIGFIDVNESCCLPCQWFPTGEYFANKMPCANDLIAEWSNTPDPGEGWRLLHPDEDLEEGDELLVYAGKRIDGWQKVFVEEKRQSAGWIYRRRITPRYEPYTWDDREELRGRWYRKKGDNVEVLITHLTKQNCDSCSVSINSWSADAFLICCEWLDGTPCGKKVE